MIGLFITLLLTAGDVDSLGRQSLHGLTFKGPTTWAKSQSDAQSISWEEPSSGAMLAISVYPVDPQRSAQECVGQMIEALGTDGFKDAVLARQPAAKKTSSDYVGTTNEANKVTTTTVVGCDGKTKWLLTWTSKTSAGARFGPIFKRVLDSLSYRK